MTGHGFRPADWSAVRSASRVVVQLSVSGGQWRGAGAGRNYLPPAACRHGVVAGNAQQQQLLACASAVAEVLVAAALQLVCAL